MWNSFNTAGPCGLTAEIREIPGGKGDWINAYVARPVGAGPFPGVVLLHHLPGWDELYQEFARRFANHGYLAVAPNLYYRFGHGTPDDVGARAKAAGGVADVDVVADSKAALEWLKAQPDCSGKVGVIGTCSGGRHAYLVAARVSGFAAAADLWGGRVVTAPAELTPQQPVAPIDYTKDLNVPLLGLFGNDDKACPPEHVDMLEAELKKHGKNYEFHRYDGAGHAFWYHDRPAFRPQQAMDGWEKVFTFFGKHLT